MVSRQFFAHHFQGIAVLAFLLIFAGRVRAEGYVKIWDDDGDIRLVPDGRKPSLYTESFNGCMENSSIILSQFSAAFYRDNRTVLFNFEGQSLVPNDTLMVYIGVAAYGEPRYELIFDPCETSVTSLCPLNSSVPIKVDGLVVLVPADTKYIQSIAYSIPDFEGLAILRIFSNSSQSQIACQASIVTNGHTFGHPRVVGSIISGFLVLCLVSSLALSIYGDDPVSNRTHYAHGPSVFVAFAVLHHIYFTGALSLNWPKVLVAFWRNYAWFAGMIHSKEMQNSVNRITSTGASRTQDQSELSGSLGDFDMSRIYKRHLEMASQSLNELPQLGNYSSFAGTLAQERITVSNAFLTGLIWFLVVLVGVPIALGFVKLSMEVLLNFDLIPARRLGNFRIHWMEFAAAAAGRIFFIGFFMMSFLTLFEFSLAASSAVRGIAAITFLVLLVGLGLIIGSPITYQLREGSATELYRRDRMFIIKENSRIFPVLRKTGSTENVDESARIIASFPWFTICCLESRPNGQPVHMDKYFVAKCGWLTSRFRFKVWWFCVLWVLHDFIRACVLAGTIAHPERQVIGILALETIAVFFMVWLRPFESTRLNIIVVYLLGFSKVSVPALLVAFLPRYHHGRVTFTVIGIIVIIIQGTLVVSLLLSMLIGFVTTVMSLTRYKERPSAVEDAPSKREMYFRHLHVAATGIKPTPPPPSSVATTAPSSPRDPYFNVSSVRRYPKISDEVTGNADNINNVVELVTLNSNRNLQASLSREYITSTPELYSGGLSSVRSYGSLTNPFAGRWEARCAMREDGPFNDGRHSPSIPEGVVIERGI
ncbi:hypothetical protein VTO42DRAFT_7798 [Malbranchea cinnamomea]